MVQQLLPRQPAHRVHDPRAPLPAGRDCAGDLGVEVDATLGEGPDQHRGGDELRGRRGLDLGRHVERQRLVVAARVVLAEPAETTGALGHDRVVLRDGEAVADDPAGEALRQERLHAGEVHRVVGLLNPCRRDAGLGDGETTRPADLDDRERAVLRAHALRHVGVGAGDVPVGLARTDEDGRPVGPRVRARCGARSRRRRSSRSRGGRCAGRRRRSTSRRGRSCSSTETPPRGRSSARARSQGRFASAPTRRSTVSALFRVSRVPCWETWRSIVPLVDRPCLGMSHH